MKPELVTEIKDKFFANFLDVIPNTNVLIIGKDDIAVDNLEFIGHFAYVLGGKFSIINTAIMRRSGNWLTKLIRKITWPNDLVILDHCIKQHMGATTSSCKPLIVFVFSEKMTTKAIDQYKDIYNVYFIDVRCITKMDLDLPTKDEYEYYDQREIGLQIINRDLVNWIKSAGNYYLANLKKKPVVK